MAPSLNKSKHPKDTSVTRDLSEKLRRRLIALANYERVVDPDAHTSGTARGRDRSRSPLPRRDLTGQLEDLDQSSPEASEAEGSKDEGEPDSLGVEDTPRRVNTFKRRREDETEPEFHNPKAPAIADSDRSIGVNTGQPDQPPTVASQGTDPKTQDVGVSPLNPRSHFTHGSLYTVSTELVQYLLNKNTDPPLTLRQEFRVWRKDNWSGLIDPPNDLEGVMFLEALEDDINNSEAVMRFQIACNNLAMARKRHQLTRGGKLAKSKSGTGWLPFPQFDNTVLERPDDHESQDSTSTLKLIATKMEECTHLIERAVDKLCTTSAAVIKDHAQSLRAVAESTFAKMDQLTSDSRKLGSPMVPTSSPLPPSSLLLPGTSKSVQTGATTGTTTPKKRPPIKAVSVCV